ncbi:MAG: hypothetical protein OXG34_03925 [bacterium]|nr:hypothetical protein [bacterium]
MGRLLASIARNTATTASIAKLASDSAGGTGPPARKLVITASGYGYDRPDGVAVVPLTALTV